ncbi:MAG: M20/M25/M40 family metallo-hydrolase [Chitinophagales bacterium]
MKNLFRFLCLLLLPAGALHSQPGIKTAPDLKTDLQEHIRYLASDSLHGRMTGSPDEKLAADYIINQFVKLGLPNSKGNYNKKKYLQAFSYTSRMDSTRKKVTGNNVLAFMNNKAATTIVIGAHYDHLGMGLPAHSMYRGEPAVHNGADDNASGVAMVIELAKKLASEPTHRHNYLFILFSGEELGLYGSKWYVEHPGIPTGKIDYMLNFDMVGRMDSVTHTLIVGGVGTSTDWAGAFDTLSTGIHLKTTESGVGPSDHTSFYLKNIPVLHFFTGQHKDYHKPSDDEEKINYDGMQRVFNFTAQLLHKLDEKDRLVFIKTKDDNSDDAPKFTVTLGVMPDYTFEGEGMRIDGVTDGKPASKAGLTTGDVVIKLGQLDVKDMMGYMKALAQFKKGDATTVKIKRGKDILVKDIQF